MRFITRLLSTTTVVTLVAVGAMAAPASAAFAHVDGLDVDLGGSAVTLDVKTYSPPNDDTSLTSFDVPSNSTVTIQNTSAWNCLGPGTTQFVLPMTESVAMDNDVVYLGWNTEDVAAGTTTTLELVSSDVVPAGGKFALYQTVLGNPSVKFNTNSAAGCAKSSFTVGAGTHAHGNWVFSAAGIYTLVFRASANGFTSSNVSYTFDVG